MSSETLITLLERLEASGAAVKFFGARTNYRSHWRLTFADEGEYLFDDPVLSEFPLSDPTRAVLLGWAVQAIEAAGYVRNVFSHADNVALVVFLNEPPERFCEVNAPTELEATLIALAEILEAKDA